MVFDWSHYWSVCHPHVAAMWMLSVTFVSVSTWAIVHAAVDQRRETNGSDEVATAPHSPHHRALFGALIHPHSIPTCMNWKFRGPFKCHHLRRHLWPVAVIFPKRKIWQNFNKICNNTNRKCIFLTFKRCSTPFCKFGGCILIETNLYLTHRWTLNGMFKLLVQVVFSSL